MLGCSQTILLYVGDEVEEQVDVEDGDPDDTRNADGDERET